MGLLVAGVTGGQSLIQSAKTRAVINEATGYKRAVNIFYAKNGRLPGDPDGTGRMGKFSENYEDIGEYSGETVGMFKPWEEMASEGIVEYNLDTTDYWMGKESKYVKSVVYRFTYANAGNVSYNFDEDYEVGLKNTNIMEFDSRYLGYIPAYIAAGIEEKIDDKSLTTGNVRIDYGCFTTIPEIQDDEARIELEWEEGDIRTYKELANAKNGICNKMIFKLDL